MSREAKITLSTDNNNIPVTLGDLRSLVLNADELHFSDDVPVSAGVSHMGEVMKLSVVFEAELVQPILCGDHAVDDEHYDLIVVTHQDPEE